MKKEKRFANWLISTGESLGGQSKKTPKDLYKSKEGEKAETPPEKEETLEEIVQYCINRQIDLRNQGNNLVETIAKEVKDKDQYEAFEKLLSGLIYLTLDEINSLICRISTRTIVFKGEIIFVSPQGLSNLNFNFRAASRAIGSYSIIRHLLKDRNFVNSTSFQALCEIYDDMYYDDDLFPQLIEYFSFGDGVGHWHSEDEKAIGIFNDIAIHLAENNYAGPISSEFQSFLAPLINLFAANQSDDWEVLLKALRQEKIEDVKKFFSSIDFGGTYDDDFCSEWLLWRDDKKLFQLYLDSRTNTEDLADDNMFDFLMYTGQLPERFKKDSRWNDLAIEKFQKAEFSLENFVELFDNNQFAAIKACLPLIEK